MLQHDTTSEPSNHDLNDAEVHSAAPDPQGVDPVDNPVSCHFIDGISIVSTHIQHAMEEGCVRITGQKKYYEFAPVYATLIYETW